MTVVIVDLAASDPRPVVKQGWLLPVYPQRAPGADGGGAVAAAAAAADGSMESQGARPRDGLAVMLDAGPYFEAVGLGVQDPGLAGIVLQGRSMLPVGLFLRLISQAFHHQLVKDAETCLGDFLDGEGRHDTWEFVKGEKWVEVGGVSILMICEKEDWVEGRKS